MAEKTADEPATEQELSKTQDEKDGHPPVEDFSCARTTPKSLQMTLASFQTPSLVKEEPTAATVQAATKQRHHSAFSFESISSEEEYSRKALEDRVEEKGKEKRSGTRKRFSDEDLAVLEETFEKIKHPYEFLVTKLANDLNTSEQKVLRWFSARRLRWRQERDLEEQTRSGLRSPQASSSSRTRSPSKSSVRKK